MNLATIIGNGKTFAGAGILISAGILNYFGALPPSLHIDLSPASAVATGLISLGLGAKLQTLIGLLQSK